MGFTKTVLRAGNGVLPKRGQQVTVHCTGYGKNRDLAEKFWSTKDPGQEPFTFQVGMGQVIKGWDEGVIGMSLGEVAKIHCSPDYAYGYVYEGDHTPSHFIEILNLAFLHHNDPETLFLCPLHFESS
mmetsp:Transcript_29214/g.62064  ORF Transcript_29214/g.62064 Transcript_29214/m.62064 type:complete len:127 (-) Transcript_29214:388-768(-)